MTGADLRERRERLGLSQSALASKLGTTQNTVSRWELGTLPMERPQMLDLALRALEQEAKSKKR